jgi:hypothetical protein
MSQHSVVGAEPQETIARITGALRVLEEHQRAGLRPHAEVTFFIGALDRTLTVEERAYTAMVFASCRELRDELTVMLVKRLGVPRGGVIAAMRAHLAATFNRRVVGDVPGAVVAYLDELRAQVLAKASRLR